MMFEPLKFDCTFEPPNDKTNKIYPPSLIRVFAVRSIVAKESSFFHADSEGSDQTGRMIWAFAGRTCHFLLVLSWGGSVNCSQWGSFLTSCLLSYTLLFFWKGIYSTRKKCAPLGRICSSRGQICFTVYPFQKETKHFWKSCLTYNVPYLPYVFRQTCLSKQCRPRWDAPQRGVSSGLHCLPLVQLFLSIKWTSVLRS